MLRLFCRPIEVGAWFVRKGKAATGRCSIHLPFSLRPFFWPQVRGRGTGRECHLFFSRWAVISEMEIISEMEMSVFVVVHPFTLEEDVS